MRTSTLMDKKNEILDEQTPLFKDIKAAKEVFWANPNKEVFEKAAEKSRLSKIDIEDADARLTRFASYLKIVFPDTAPTDGIIESPITEIPNMKAYLEEEYKGTIEGKV